MSHVEKMTDTPKTCPACGGPVSDHCPGQQEYVCVKEDCDLYDIYMDDRALAWMHKAIRTLPDGTELEPGETYSVTRVDHTHGNTNVAYFTIPSQEAPDA